MPSTATAKTKKRKSKFSLDKFVVPTGSIPEKMAKLLDWAADEAPRVILRYPQIAKVLLDMDRLPRQDAKEVDMIKGRVSATRQKLVQKFGRDLVTEPGIGCRATVDDSDVLQFCVTKRARRLMVAKDRLTESIGIIEEEGLLENSDIPELVQWLTDELNPLIKKLQDPKAVRALLPPEVKDDDDGSNGA